MPAFRDQDIAALFRDFAVPVRIGSTTGLGFLDREDHVLVEDEVRGQVMAPVSVVTVQTSAFPELKEDVAINVNGNLYTVRERLRIGDGALTKILLGTN